MKLFLIKFFWVYYFIMYCLHRPVKHILKEKLANYFWEIYFCSSKV